MAKFIKKITFKKIKYAAIAIFSSWLIYDVSTHIAGNAAKNKDISLDAAPRQFVSSLNKQLKSLRQTRKNDIWIDERRAEIYQYAAEVELLVPMIRHPMFEYKKGYCNIGWEGARELKYQIRFFQEKIAYFRENDMRKFAFPIIIDLVGPPEPPPFNLIPIASELEEVEECKNSWWSNVHAMALRNTFEDSMLGNVDKGFSTNAEYALKTFDSIGNAKFNTFNPAFFCASKGPVYEKLNGENAIILQDCQTVLNLVRNAYEGEFNIQGEHYFDSLNDYRIVYKLPFELFEKVKRHLDTIPEDPEDKDMLMDLEIKAIFDKHRKKSK